MHSRRTLLAPRKAWPAGGESHYMESRSVRQTEGFANFFRLIALLTFSGPFSGSRTSLVWLWRDARAWQCGELLSKSSDIGGEHLPYPLFHTWVLYSLDPLNK